MGKCKLPNSNEMMKYMSGIYIGFIPLQRVDQTDIENFDKILKSTYLILVMIIFYSLKMSTS